MAISYLNLRQIKLLFLTLIAFVGLGCLYSYSETPLNLSDKCYGCPPKERKNYPEKSLDELIYMLRTTKGSFREPYFYKFEGDEKLFDAISEYGHAAVERLVDSLDSTEPTSVAWHGRPIWLGVMSWIALRYVAYYEPTIEERWEGTLVEMPEKPAELQAVKKAWQKVVKKRAYVLH